MRTMKKKRVAISTRVVRASGYEETRDALSHDWYLFLQQIGLTPFLVPNLGDQVVDYLDGVDISGVILTSGNIVCPQTYHMKDEGVPDTSVARDRTESILIELAIAQRLPILGVCRGMQILNAHFGGTILADLASRIGALENHVASEHRIRILLPEWIRKFGRDAFVVNSFHDQGLTQKELSPQLVGFAASEQDNVIEGVVHRDLPIVGVQWHPERKNPAWELDRALVRSLFLEGSVAANLDPEP